MLCNSPPMASVRRCAGAVRVCDDGIQLASYCCVSIAWHRAAHPSTLLAAATHCVPPDLFSASADRCIRRVDMSGKTVWEDVSAHE